MKFHGELICEVVTSFFDSDTGNQRPMNPHQIAAAKYRLRLSDLARCPVNDRPPGTSIEEFHATGTLHAFRAAEAASDTEVLWWESIEDDEAHIGRLKDEIPDRDERRNLRKWLQQHSVPREWIRKNIKSRQTRTEISSALIEYVKSLLGGVA